MRIKLDENLPVRLVDVLADLGHDVDSVPMEGLSGRSDEAVWAAARNEGRFLVTQDLDFSDLRRFSPGSHDGVLIVRLRQPGRAALIHRIGSFFQSEKVSDLAGCFVVLTERKVRIRRPSSRP